LQNTNFCSDPFSFPSACRPNQPNRPPLQRSPPTCEAFSFSYSSLTSGADSSAPPLLSSPTFPHRCAAPCRTPARARDGTAGPPPGTHTERGAPVCVPRCLPGGAKPSYPSPATPKATTPPTAAPPSRSPAAPTNQSACHVLALATLTHLYNPRDRAHLAR
jgi:hypothetical protein